MKKVLVAVAGMMLLLGCSKKTQYTQDLTGTWIIYNYTYFSIVQQPQLDTFIDDKYTITFTSGGQYTEQYVFSADTVQNTGTWQFQDSYGQLVLTDTAARTLDTFTILNLTGNSVELLRDGYDRYMRKNQ